MTDTVGFWKLAEEEPGRLAVSTRAGARSTYGELWAESNRLVHGLRALGLHDGRQRGRGAAQRHRDARPVLRGHAGRLVPHADQPPPGRARDRLHRATTARPRRFVGHERFADACAKAASRRSRSARTGASPIGDGRRASARTPTWSTGSPTDAPDERIGRRADALHVGHDRTSPRACGAGSRASTPTRRRGCARLPHGLFGIQAHDDNVHICGSPLYHTAVLRVRVDVAAPRPPRRAHGQVDARRRCCELIDEHR